MALYDKELRSDHLKLLKFDYLRLKNDSYVKLNQIIPFLRKAKILFRLTDEDISLSCLKLMESLKCSRCLKRLQISKLIQPLVICLKTLLKKRLIVFKHMSYSN